MESIVSTFHIDWKIIIAQVVNFGLVFLVLYLYALKPLSKLMSERTDKISRGVMDAKTNAELLERSQREYDMSLEKARQEANKIFQNGKREAELKKMSMMEEAKTEVAGMIESGKKMLAAEKTKMVEEARSEIVSLATLAAEKLIKNKHDLSKI